jgi:hypothetical protein
MVVWYGMVMCVGDGLLVVRKGLEGGLVVGLVGGRGDCGGACGCAWGGGWKREYIDEVAVWVLVSDNGLGYDGPAVPEYL